MDEPTKSSPPSRPSQIPSWVLLGFVVGALFVWALPHGPKANPEPAAAIKRTTVILERPKATDIEAVFADWGRYAVWDRDVTEVALWDVDRKEYSICYEILRVGDSYYFRSIPHLTRTILTHGVPEHSPLVYTETEDQRREWLNAKLSEPIKPPEARKSP